MAEHVEHRRGLRDRYDVYVATGRSQTPDRAADDDLLAEWLKQFAEFAGDRAGIGDWQARPFAHGRTVPSDNSPDAIRQRWKPYRAANRSRASTPVAMPWK